MFVEVEDPLSVDEWDVLSDEIVEFGSRHGAKVVALPRVLPTTMGMADELSRSLANHLRERGFSVLGSGPGP